ncbi:MAG: histidine phosphatase family protein [Candidatus Latescibacteria bacterium]|jgi:2,3-bisphosphoglycerate-dependent phosphoglycerate mutase|nr:histidine phosphatase family protein [Candidatus Latescibacterota bacterium]
MELYFIRHGESFNNALEDPTRRMCDPPLTMRGREQAKLVAAHLNGGQPEGEDDSPALAQQNRRGYGIGRIICSAMLRTMETTAPIAEALQIRPEVWLDLHEQYGIWQDTGDGRGPVGYPGLKRKEAESRFPDYDLPDAFAETGWWNRPVETEEEWLARAERVAAELRNRFGGTEEKIALVSHGGFGNYLIHALLCDGSEDGVYYSHQNTAVSRIDFPESGPVRVRYFNRVEHLPSDLVS